MPRPGLQITKAWRNQLIEWCKRSQPQEHLDPALVGACEAELEAAGLQRRLLGYSRSGRPINCLSLEAEDPQLRIFAYGYPHPDEPTGGTAVLELARRLAAGDLPPGLEHASWYLVLCADPDQAMPNRRWIRDPQLVNCLHHHWRPQYLGLEVDYAFPIDWGPFYQPRGWTRPGLRLPLPESLALADLISDVRPHLVGTMHANHASGVYSFFNHRPHASLIDAFDISTRAFGLRVHRGERPDPGKRWVKTRTDLLKERTLQDRLRRLRELVGDPGNRRYLGCVSIAQYLESLDPEAVILTPEVGIFDLPGIDDTQPTEQTRVVCDRIEQTRRGPRRVVRGMMEMPDGSARQVCYHIHPPDTPSAGGEVELALTRGMAGVEAIERRRFWLARADRLWQAYRHQLDLLTDRRRERERIRVPARAVNDRAMLIFRTSPTYMRTATVAEALDFEVRWALQDCLWLGHARQLYEEQGLEEAEAKAAALLELASSRLPALTPTPVAAQVQSQLARLLMTAAAMLHSRARGVWP